MKNYSEFFRFDSHANLVSFIVYIAALFEKRNDTINLEQILCEMKKSQLVSESVANEASKLLSSVAPIVKKAAVLRNNAIAHRSASISYNDVFRLAGVRVDELCSLTDVALRVANLLLVARGQPPQYFNEISREHVAAMLIALRESRRAD